MTHSHRTKSERKTLGKLGTTAMLVALFVAACGVSGPPKDQRPTPASPPVGSGESCSAGADLLGFSDALDKQTFGGTNVGGLSALTPAGEKDTYYALVDNELLTQSRFYTLKIPVGESGLAEPRVEGVTKLRRDSGGFNGLDFDGEGLAGTRRGELYAASERGPSIRRFNRDGEQVSELPVPQKFLVFPAGEGESNATFESLSFTRDERNLFTGNEGPLSGDGETADGEARLRILAYERGRGGFEPAREFYYLAEPGGQGLVEIVALSRDRLLTLERGFVRGEGNTARVFEVSLEGARDVSEESLEDTDVRPVGKELLVDLADCPAGDVASPGEQRNPLLDNFEAMSLGERLPGGGRELILASDDNFGGDQTTRIVALAVDLRDRSEKARR